MKRRAKVQMAPRRCQRREPVPAPFVGDRACRFERFQRVFTWNTRAAGPIYALRAISATPGAQIDRIVPRRLRERARELLSSGSHEGRRAGRWRSSSDRGPGHGWARREGRGSGRMGESARRAGADDGLPDQRAAPEPTTGARAPPLLCPLAPPPPPPLPASGPPLATRLPGHRPSPHPGCSHAVGVGRDRRISARTTTASANPRDPLSPGRQPPRRPPFACVRETSMQRPGNVTDGPGKEPDPYPEIDRSRPCSWAPIALRSVPARVARNDRRRRCPCVRLAWRGRQVDRRARLAKIPRTVFPAREVALSSCGAVLISDRSRSWGHADERAPCPSAHVEPIDREDDDCASLPLGRGLYTRASARRPVLP